MRFVHCSMLLLCLLVCVSPKGWAADNNRHLRVISGTVLSAADNQPASFAVIGIDKLNLHTMCDIDGRFSLAKVPEGEHVLGISCLGFSPKQYRVKVRRNIDVLIKLAVSSVSLPELEVMARRTKHDKVVVDEAAIEYIQPTSLADVLLLLPGNVYKENTMSGFSQISSRQVGSDANSSLGMAIMTDGAPESTDGMRTQLVGVTENSMGRGGDSEIRQRTGMNQGVDMRYLSTDHIQSVEFTRGISSARYGNLSSGMIQVKSKHGVTPLRMRAKVDLKNKLIYAGKGFKLSDKAGTLHVGADFLNSMADVREEKDKFSRFTAQAFYNNQLKWNKVKLDIEAKLSQTLSMNKMKTDELIQEYDESYKADYSKTAMMLKGNLTTGTNWLDKLEFLLSSDVVFDKITRHKMVLSSSGPMSAPLAKEEGEHEGMYLPGKYYSDFYIDNIPVNLFIQLNATSRFQLAKPLGLNLMYGLEYRRTKNKGNGAVIEDETRPPFPYDNSYMRPRPNWQIPALSVGAAYLQADWLYSINDDTMFKLSAGGRVTRMFNLDKEYALSGKYLAEPRLNASFTFGKKVKNSFRAGFGLENKLPTLDYLYPEKLYKDFYMMNAYDDNPNYRRLITYTNIYDIANKNLKANQNCKFELGYDLVAGGFDLSLTGFYEKTNSGFEYFTVYHPVSYDFYNQVRPGVEMGNHVPQKADYIKEKYQTFTNSSRVMNSKKTVKKGIEYRVIFPQIEPLYTRIELNGAFYKTSYGSSLDEYYYSGARIADKPYPYMAIYDNDPQTEYRRLNTNIWMNTHIPKFKLIFTNFIQVVWISSDQYKDRHQKYPYAYMDVDGKMHQVGQVEIDKMNSTDMLFRAMKKTIYPIEYARNDKPISLLWNIKATKEFNKYAKMSFFVNGILDIHPKYMTGGMKTDRDWTDPYFGVELFLNFNL